MLLQLFGFNNIILENSIKNVGTEDYAGVMSVIGMMGELGIVRGVIYEEADVHGYGDWKTCYYIIDKKRVKELVEAAKSKVKKENESMKKETAEQSAEEFYKELFANDKPSNGQLANGQSSEIN